jgi:hypothetical protein
VSNKEFSPTVTGKKHEKKNLRYRLKKQRVIDLPCFGLEFKLGIYAWEHVGPIIYIRYSRYGKKIKNHWIQIVPLIYFWKMIDWTAYMRLVSSKHILLAKNVYR